jgi:hypothetical protein
MPAISYHEAHGPGGYEKSYGTPAASAGSHLTPELEVLVGLHQADHAGYDQAGRDLGPCTHPMANPTERWNGKCAAHRLTPAERAEQRRWERHAAAVNFVQAEAAGHLRDVVPVYAHGEAVQRDSRLVGRPPVVDRVSYLP